MRTAEMMSAASNGYTDGMPSDSRYTCASIARTESSTTRPPMARQYVSTVPAGYSGYTGLQEMDFIRHDIRPQATCPTLPTEIRNGTLKDIASEAKAGAKMNGTAFHC